MLNLTAQQFQPRLFNLKGMKGTRQMDGFAGPIMSLVEGDDHEDVVDVNCDWMVQLSADLGNAIIYANEHLGTHPEDLDDDAYAYIKTSTTAIIKNYRDSNSKSLKSYEKWDFVMAELFCSLLKMKSKNYQASLNFVYDYFRYINVDKEYTGFLKNIVKILRGEVKSNPIRSFIGNMNKSFSAIKKVQNKFVQYFEKDRWKYISNNIHTKNNAEIFADIFKLNAGKDYYASKTDGNVGYALRIFMETMSTFKALTIADLKRMGNTTANHDEVAIEILMDHLINRYRRSGSKFSLEAIDSVILMIIRPDGLETPYKSKVLEILDLRRVEIQERLRLEKAKKK